MSMPEINLIWAVYQREKSVKRTADYFNISKDAVWKGLKAAGYKLQQEDWTTTDLEALRNYHENTPEDQYHLSVIASQLQRSVIAVSLKIHRLGWAKRKQIPLPGSTQRRSESTKRAIERYGHPRKGVTFTMSEEWKQHVLEGRRKGMETARRNGTGCFSEESRQRQSDRFHSYQVAGKARSGYCRGKMGKREDLGGLYVRSAWEANIARYLNLLQSKGQVHRWEYESETFIFETIKRGTRSYTPDFKIWDTPESLPYYWEVKGWMDQKSRTKLDRMERYFPDVKIILIDEQAYKSIAKWKALIQGWE